jgi:quinol monooxygenase YgiN
MYGLINKFRAHSGKREELITIMMAGAVKMPGCISYVIARDPADTGALWITEVWDSKASHAGSLAIPEVKMAIQKAMPLIAGFDKHIETEPVSVA